MLRLWPDRLVAVVLPDCARLYRSGSEVARYDVAATNAQFNVLDGVDALLDSHSRARHVTVELVVSDSVARVIPLIWQDSLKNDEQCAAYARACLAQVGFDLGDEWAVQAAFRHFRATGLGYALPRSLVVDVEQRMLKRRIRLSSIMPLSAHAYWQIKNDIRGERIVLLLREHRRLSALLFNGRKCVGMHVQPVGNELRDAARRLLSTVQAEFPLVSRFQYWTSAVSVADAELESIKKHVSLTNFELISRLGWN